MRLENLARLSSLWPSRAAFCKAIDASPPHVSQLFQSPKSTGYRGIGAAFARKVERLLAIPRFSLDKPNGVEPYTLEVTQRNRLAPPAPAAALTVADRFELRPASTSPMQSLHAAALAALEQAMREGRVSQGECLALLTKYLGAEANAAGTQP